MTEAIVVMDMTNDSIAPKARSLDLRMKSLKQTSAFLDWARNTGRPVLHVDSGRLPADKWFLKHWEWVNMLGSNGQRPIPALLKEGDTVIAKRRYSGFFQSELDLTLRDDCRAHGVVRVGGLPRYSTLGG